MNRALDLEAVGEIAPRLLVTADAGQKMRGLDHLEVVETQLMSRRRAELPIRRMLRAGEDGGKAPLGRGTLGAIEPEFVHPLLIELDHALVAMHLEADGAL